MRSHYLKHARENSGESRFNEGKAFQAWRKLRVVTWRPHDRLAGISRSCSSVRVCVLCRTFPRLAQISRFFTLVGIRPPAHPFGWRLFLRCCSPPPPIVFLCKPSLVPSVSPSPSHLRRWFAASKPCSVPAVRIPEALQRRWGLSGASACCSAFLSTAGDV